MHAYFQDKGPQKSQVAIQHVGLAKKADVAKTKARWAERLTALGALLRG